MKWGLLCIFKYKTRLKELPFRGSRTGKILGILIPTLIFFLALIGYFGFRKCKYGVWFQKESKNTVADNQALLSGATF